MTIPAPADSTVPNTAYNLFIQWTVLNITQADLAGHYLYVVLYRVSSDASTYGLQPYITSWQPAASTVSHIAGVDVLNYTLGGLMYNTPYDIKVVPYRKFGSSTYENGTESYVTKARTDCDSKLRDFVIYSLQ